MNGIWLALGWNVAMAAVLAVGAETPNVSQI